MKVMKKYSMNFPAVEYTGPTNRCRCGKMPRYFCTPCGGYGLKCECGAQTDIHVPNLTKQNANLLREEWNSLIINSELSPEFVKIYNLDNGDLIIFRATDSCLHASYDNMDDALYLLKEENRKNFTVDYDLTQLIRIPNGNFIIAHIATSKALAYVAGWEGFKYEMMTPVDN